MEDPPSAWIARILKTNEKLGFDPWVTTVAEARRLKAATDAAGAKLVALPRNPVDSVWKDQPPRPSQPIEAQDLAHSGLAAAEKLKSIAVTLVGLKADAVLLADPASVCWALNIRGSDVPYTPFPLAYALAHRKAKAELFAESKRLTAAAKDALKAVAIARAPETLAERLAVLKGKTVALDPNLAPEAARLALLKAGAKVIESPDPACCPRRARTPPNRKVPAPHNTAMALPSPASCTGWP